MAHAMSPQARRAHNLACGALIAGGLATAIAYIPPPEDAASRHLPFKVVGALVVVTLLLSVAAYLGQKRSGEPMTRLVRLAFGVGVLFFALFAFFAVFVVDLMKLH